jgi:hypothetical protein
MQKLNLSVDLLTKAPHKESRQATAQAPQLISLGIISSITYMSTEKSMQTTPLDSLWRED